ncbi:hypothetical protein KSP40_PGU002062 [Platanthera guangdongensis]|uniref:Uncharacterized protein n=1 Tax=Platanthera guangdongensis TaxID=2320717 RepID=A0ABR2MQN8_9ASPA
MPPNPLQSHFPHQPIAILSPTTPPKDFSGSGDVCLRLPRAIDESRAGPLSISRRYCRRIPVFCPTTAAGILSSYDPTTNLPWLPATSPSGISVHGCDLTKPIPLRQSLQQLS